MLVNVAQRHACGLLRRIAQNRIHVVVDLVHDVANLGIGAELCKRLAHLLEAVLAPLNVARGQVGGIRVIRAVARKERDALAAPTRRYPGGENGFPSIYALTVQTFLQ